MYRLITKMILAAALICLFPLVALASPTVIVDGKSLICEQPPVIQNGSTLVPMRAIFEALGAEVTWDETMQAATATLGSKNIYIAVGAQIGCVNNVETVIDTPAILRNGRVMVPLRFISEGLGASVEWDGARQEARITSAKQTTNQVAEIDIDNMTDKEYQDFLNSAILKDTIGGKELAFDYIIVDRTQDKSVVHIGVTMRSINAANFLANIGSGKEKCEGDLITLAFDFALKYIKKSIPVYVDYRLADFYKDKPIDLETMASISWDSSSNSWYTTATLLSVCFKDGQYSCKWIFDDASSSSSSSSNKIAKDYLKQLQDQQKQQQAEIERLKKEANDQLYQTALNRIESGYESKVNSLNNWKEQQIQYIQARSRSISTNYGNQLLEDLNEEYAAKLQEIKQWRQTEINKLDEKYKK